MTKVCLECATVNRFRWLPCVAHAPAVDPTNCKHESVSAVIHADALETCSATRCHGCGNYADNCETLDKCFTCQDALEYTPAEGVPALCYPCQDDLEHFLAREALYLTPQDQGKK